jgi:hypothetical protein
MISDSPYNVGTRVLSPIAGLTTGFIATMVMLGLLAALQSVSGFRLTVALTDLARIFSPGLNSPTTNFTLILVGWGPLAIIGTLLGLLYAMCQQHIPVSGLFGVGLFYGFVLWVLSKLTIGLFFHQIAQSSVSGWLWLLAWLLYGLCLAVASVWFQLRPSAKSAQVVLKD